MKKKTERASHNFSIDTALGYLNNFGNVLKTAKSVALNISINISKRSQNYMSAIYGIRYNFKFGDFELSNAFQI